MDSDYKDTGSKYGADDKDFQVDRKSKQKKNDESRRNVKWVSFTKKKVSFGFQHLLPGKVPTMSPDVRGLAVCLQKVTNWRVPAAAQRSFGTGDFEVTVQLSLSLFHLGSSSFFGSTWMGPSIPLGDGKYSEQLNDFECVDIIYMMSRLSDPSCVGVVEIVASKVDPKTNLVINQYGCGWTMINLFSKPYPADIIEGYDSGKLMSCAMFHGSPRELIVNGDIKTLSTRLREIKNCTLFFKLFSHRKLLRAQGLIAENETLGRFEEIAGLVCKNKIPPDATKARLMACIGDEEVVNPPDDVKVSPVAPVLATPLITRISNFQLFIPSRNQLELRVIETYAKLLDAHGGRKPDATGKLEQPQILSRTVKIGLHNGHTVVGGNWNSYSLVEASDTSEILMPVEKELSMIGYVPNDYMAIVFLVQYEVGIPTARPSHIDPGTMMSSATTKRRDTTIVMTIGAGYYIPCADNKIWLRNKERDVDDRDGVDIEIPVVKDEICTILTPKLVMQDPDSVESAMNSMDLSRPGMSGKESMVAEEKTDRRSLSIRQSGATTGVGGIVFTSTIGFDLNIEHPKLGALKHLEDITPLLETEDPPEDLMGTIADFKATIADEEEREARIRRSTVGSRFESDAIAESKLGGTSAKFSRTSRSLQSLRLKPSAFSPKDRRDFDEFDDGRSVAEESVVTGDSERSSIHLNYLHYGEGAARAVMASRTSRDAQLALRDAASEISTTDSHAAGQFVVPRDKNSLMARCLQANLGLQGRDIGGGVTGHRGEVLERRMGGGDMRPAPKTIVDINSNAAHIRELSRGARSRLNRHGFEGAIQDNAVTQIVGDLRGAKYRDPSSNKNSVIDVDLEARDELMLHDVAFQFAGYRVGKKLLDAEDNVTDLSAQFPTPHNIYCTYQFYSCMATRTEVMRLLPSDIGQMQVLVREEGHMRDETPLALRYMVDCSTSSPVESREFAEYLAYSALYVDVWDADSLLLLGTASIPLRKLMRQGQPVVKFAAECDLINYDSVSNAQGGIASYVVAENGPVSGSIVGSIQVIMSNTGMRGHGVMKPGKSLPYHNNQENAGLNWRAYGVGQDQSLGKNALANRPKTSIRAKPLSETSPELQKAIESMKNSADAKASEMRSLAVIRGTDGNSTLNYNEVALLSKRFHGTAKNTVQYMGDMMTLMGVTSWGMALKKLITIFHKYGYEAFTKELRRHASPGLEMKFGDVEECFFRISKNTGVACSAEEIALIARKLTHDTADGYVTVAQIAEFCLDESDRLDWTIVSKRFRLAVSRAYADGVDVEQLLAEKDSDGSHHISHTIFREVLNAIAKFGLNAKDIASISKHFVRRVKSAERPRLPISLQDIMSFLGKDYVGNLQLRIIQCFHQYGITMAPKDIMRLFHKHRHQVPAHAEHHHGREVYTYDEVEDAFREANVFHELTHEQVRSVIKRLDTKAHNTVSMTQILTFLKIPFKASDLTQEQYEGSSKKLSVATDQPPEATTEDLLRLLLDKVQENGVAVDEAFRHFDTNGDGFISPQELESGMEKLCIFDHIPNWKKQLGMLVKKFDKNGDSMVSLREFFQYLGIQDYAPNIIQRLTKIFALATTNGVSFTQIFEAIDTDKSGKIDSKELLKGIEQFASLESVNAQDIHSVVQKFDKDGDNTISLDEFTAYFASRVKKAIEDRRRKQGEKIATKFREIMLAAKDKGLTAQAIFEHFDKNKGGGLSTEELAASIRSFPNFKNLAHQDVTDLVALIDTDGSGEISLREFELFIDGPNAHSKGASPRASISKSTDNVQDSSNIERMRNVFRAAQSKGLSFDKIFDLVDIDKNRMITLDELTKTLQKLPHFKQLSNAEIKELFQHIDANRNGLISIEEFRSFASFGNVIDHGAVVGGGKENSSHHRLSEKDLAHHWKDLFIRHVHRISETDGSVTAFLSHLDQDGDGLITDKVLKAEFRLEKVFDTLPEKELDILLEPMTNSDGQIRVVSLLRFIEGSPERNYDRPSSALDEEEDRNNALVEMAKEYQWSNNLELRAVEKKLRACGQKAAKKGVNVEELFQQYDPHHTGNVTRVQLYEILSKLGLYLLETGDMLKTEMSGERDARALQKQRIHAIYGREYLVNAPKYARKFMRNDGAKEADSDFKNQLELMTLINWHRQSQKQMLLQRVLSHSLSTSINLYPRFGKTLFFEFPITNPFAHEERFIIEISDPELRLVTSFDEWLHLRRSCRPCVGELGGDPVEADMFDRDGAGNVQVALLKHEVLSIPFTFMTLLPYTPPVRYKAGKQPRHSSMHDADGKQPRRRDGASAKGGHDSKDDRDGGRGGGESKEEGFDIAEDEEPSRVIEVRIKSGTHGHIVSIVRVLICPRPFILNRTLRWYEVENTIVKRRIQLVGHENVALYPGEFGPGSKFVHCVESSLENTNAVVAQQSDQSRVVVEWGPGSDQFCGNGTLDLLIRYRCGAFPNTGMFYLLIYNDPYQSQLHEIWQVIIQTRLKLDIHGSVGSNVASDLVVRGDRFARTARAYASYSQMDAVRFQPERKFPVVPGAYNRVSVVLNPKNIGYRRIQVNLVDVESRELISAWIMMVAATTPAIMQSYDVELSVGRPVNKKIIFKNPWDIPRRFVLSSSNDTLMRPRSVNVEVPPFGSAYLRLWFNGLEPGFMAQDVYLFLNDAEGGQNEECYLFKVKPANAGNR